MMHDDVVRVRSRGDGLAFAGGRVPDADFLSPGGGSINQSVGSHGETIGLAGVAIDERLRAVGRDFVEFAGGHIGEEKRAVGSGGETFGPSVPVGDDLPLGVQINEVASAGARFAGMGGDRLRFPEPAHCLGKNGGTVLLVVPTLAPFVGGFIAGELERALQAEVRNPPVAGADIEVIGVSLDEDAKRFRLGAAHQCRIVVATAMSRVGADHGKNATEGIGPLPGAGEGGDTARGRSAEAATVRVLRDFHPVGFLHVGDELLDQEARVVAVEDVVFDGAVEPAHRLFRIERREHARLDEEADHHRDGPLVDESVHHDVGAAAGLIIAKSIAVVKDHQRGIVSGGVVLRGDVNGIFAGRAGVEPSARKDPSFQFADWHPLLSHRLGRRGVIHRRSVSGGKNKGDDGEVKGKGRAHG